MHNANAFLEDAMTVNLTRRAALVSGIALLSVGPAFAGQGPIYTSWGSAASGYDVVAYFTQSRPVKGSRSITADYKGATWRFASEENRELFIADPERYAPQFGGYCAYAVAIGSLNVSTVPEAWKIVDGKLYLNYSSGIQRRWESRQSGYIADAHKNWSQAYN